MQKIIIGVIVAVLLAIVGYYFLHGGKTTKPSVETIATTTPEAITTTTYATSTFSVTYPMEYTSDEAYAYDQFGPKKLIEGVKFTIPGTIATGTNLSIDTGISVETLPRAKNCTGDIYIKDNVKAQPITENGVQYSMASTSGAGAGNFYEEVVYALVNSAPCTAVRYLIHSTNIGNYTPGTVTEFDRAALVNDFDTIRQSLVLTPAAI